MSRLFQDDLRRIVGVDTAKGVAPDAWPDRSRIAGGRGYVPCGEEEEGCCNKNDTDSLDGGGPSSTDPADSDTTNGLRLYDCSTGDPVDVRFDGQYFPPDGCSNAPDGYEEGFYWYWSGQSVASRRSHPGAVMEWYVGYIESLSLPYTVDSYTLNSIDGPGSYIYDVTYTDTSTAQIKVRKNACSGSTETYCTEVPEGDATTPWADANTPPEGETQWPECAASQLSWNPDTAKFEPNQYDGNVPTSYSNGASVLSLCDDEGNPVTVSPTADGGFVSYNSTSQTATFYSAAGVVTGYGGTAEYNASLPQ